MPTQVIIETYNDVKPICSTTCTPRKLATRRVVKPIIWWLIWSIVAFSPSSSLVQSLKGGSWLSHTSDHYSYLRLPPLKMEAVPSEPPSAMFELVKSQPHFATKDESFATNILVRSSRDDKLLSQWSGCECASVSFQVGFQFLLV